MRTIGVDLHKTYAYVFELGQMERRSTTGSA